MAKKRWNCQNEYHEYEFVVTMIHSYPVIWAICKYCLDKKRVP